MAVGFDHSIISRVQQSNDIVDIVSEHISLSRKGREMVGLCPFHDDQRPSLYVNPTKQIFKCFACGAGGSVFTFVQMRENLTFPQALQRLAERAGIKLKPARQSKERTDDAAEVDPNMLAKVNLWAAKCFQKNLFDEEKGKAAREYLAERQISEESIKKWMIGLADSEDGLIKRAKAQKNVPIDLLIKAGLAGDTGSGNLSDKFVNRLMFPIADVTGRIIGFGGRTLDGTGAKYINSPTSVLFDKSNSMYGLEQARHKIVSSGTAVAVEGYTDCIMAHQFGCSNVVATLGTSFTAGHSRILKRYAKKIVLLFDSDTAGIEAANRALEICLLQRIDIKLASVPEGKDPCDYLLAAGQERFEELIENATDVFEFKWKRLSKTFSGDILIDNKAAVEEFMQAIAAAVHTGNLQAVDRGVIVNRLSKITGLEARQINLELARRQKTIAKTANYGGATKMENQKVQRLDLGEGLAATAQREILEVLLNEPKLFEEVKQKVTMEDFDVPALGRIAAVLFETLNSDEASLSAVLGRIEAVEVGNAAAELAMAGEEKGNFRSRLKGAIEVVQRHRAQKQKSGEKTTKDQRQFLRNVCETASKRNPHNIGMV